MRRTGQKWQSYSRPPEPTGMKSINHKSRKELTWWLGRCCTDKICCWENLSIILVVNSTNLAFKKYNINKKVLIEGKSIEVWFAVWNKPFGRHNKQYTIWTDETEIEVLGLQATCYVLTKCSTTQHWLAVDVGGKPVRDFKRPESLKFTVSMTYSQNSNETLLKLNSI